MNGASDGLQEVVDTVVQVMVHVIVAPVVW